MKNIFTRPVLPVVACLSIFSGITYAQAASPTREYLARQYLLHAMQESQDWEIQDSIYLGQAAINALSGGIIGPRNWQDVPVTSASPQELEAAREKLSYALSSGAAEQQPRIFSRALVGYDCWVGQQKAEPNASHNLTNCRGEYYRNAGSLPQPTYSREITVSQEVPMEIKELVKVYFAWDRYDLNEDAKNTLDRSRGLLQQTGNGQLVIGGYADSSGSDRYNLELSRKRAQAVADYLNLSPDRYEIDLHAFGERNLQVPTADGVRNPANRVSIIGLRTVQSVTVSETRTVSVTTRP